MASEPKIYFDSCCFIDIAADAENITTREKREYHILCYKDLLNESLKKNILVCTSYLTIVECTHVKNEEQKKIMTKEVIRRFNSIILSGLSGVIPINPTKEIIESARQLYWDGISLKPFDLLHIASAIEIGCAEFITTDRRSIDSNDNVSKIQALGLKVVFDVIDSKHLSPLVAQTKMGL